MGIKKVFLIIFMIIVLSLSTLAITPQGSFNFRSYFNLTGGDYISTNYLCLSGLCISNWQVLNDTASINAVNNRVTSVNNSLNTEIINRANADTGLQNQINLKLNISDQRYNDTSLINNINTTFFVYLAQESNERIANDSNLQNQINLKLTANDQRYNETALITAETNNRINNDTYLNNLINSVSGYNDTNLTNRINSVNNSLNSEITNRINNDTGIITTINNNFTLLNNKIISIGNWSADKIGYNTTAQLNNIYYLLTNPSGYINNSVSTLTNYYNKTYIDGLNATSLSSLQNEITNRQNNDTALDNKINSIGNWSADKASYNTTTQLNTLYQPLENQRLSTTNSVTFVNTTLTNIKASSSAGIGFYGTSGSIIALFGAGGGQAVSFYNGGSFANYLRVGSSAHGDSMFESKGSTNDGSTGIIHGYDNNSNEVFSLQSNGRLGLNNVNPSYTLDVNGTINANSIVGYNTTTQLYNQFLNLTDQRYNESALITSVNDNFINQDKITREPTGISDIDRTTTILSFNNVTRNFTLVGNYDVYINGTKYPQVNGSVIVPNISQLNFIYYKDGNIDQSTTPWVFKSTAQIATIYWNPKLQDGLVSDERHGLAMDWITHEYAHETIGTRYVSGFVGTFTNTNFTMTAGEFYDEDNEFTPSLTNNCTLIYRQGTNTTWLRQQTQYYYKNATNMYYDNNGVLTALGGNQFMAIYFYATNDKDNPIYCVLGQRSDGSLANAIANNVPSAISLPSAVPEEKLLYIVVIKNDATPYEPTGTTDYRTTSATGNTAFTPTDHDTLSNLGTQSHTAYLTLDGTRNMTGNLLFNRGLGVDYSFVLNPIWLNLTDQRFNDSSRIDSVNSSLQNEITYRQNNDSNIVTLFSDNDSTLNNKINSIGNWSADKNSYNTTSQLNNIYGKLTQNNLWTGNNIFTPTSNTTFNNDALFYGAAYFFNNVTLTNSNTMNVNGSIVIKNIGGQIIGSWNDINGTANFNTNGNITGVNLFGNLNYSYINNVPNFALLTYVQSLGNWSADKTSYNTTAQLDNRYLQTTPYQNNAAGWINTTTTTNFKDLTITNQSSGTQISFTTNNLTIKDNSDTMVTFTQDDNMIVKNNITMNTLIISKSPPMYIWYYNSTYWDCLNATGTIYNRGNSSVTCS